MAQFTLLVVPSGRALLTTTERLDDHHRQAIVETVRGWGDQYPVLIVDDCDVVQVASIDIDLTTTGPVS